MSQSGVTPEGALGQDTLGPGILGNADYIAVLRPLLPAAAFRPYWPAYIAIGLHLGVVVAGWLACRYVVEPNWWPLVGIGVAVSLSSLSFYAHDVTHRSVVRHPLLLYPTELVLWGLLFFPPTLYRRVHLAHHGHTNGELDPDRRFLACEIGASADGRGSDGRGAKLAAAWLFPNKDSRFSFLCRFYWVFFPVRNLIVLLYPGASMPSFATAKPRFSNREKAQVAFEVAFIVALQAMLIAFLHAAYVWTVLIPCVIASLVTTWYLFTNHGLHEIGDGSDILGATTSVVVPKLCDTLHSNFSYHAEHHLFPTVNPHYYPLICSLFQKHFPDHYNRMPMREAWTRLWQNSIAAERVGARPAGAGGPTRVVREVSPRGRSNERFAPGSPLDPIFNEVGAASDRRGYGRLPDT